MMEDFTTKHTLSKIQGNYFFSGKIGQGTKVVGEMRPWEEGSTLYVLNPFGAMNTQGVLEGGAHVEEHILFKSEEDINRKNARNSFKRTGGRSNGGTSFFDTDFITRVPVENIQQSINYLQQLLSPPELTPEQLEREINIIYHEIAGNHDHPREYVLEPAFFTLYDTQTPAAILGTEKTLGKLSLQDVQRFWEIGYSPDNFILGYVGAEMPLEQLVGFLENAFSNLKTFRKKDAAPDISPRPMRALEYEEHRGGLEQAHVMVGVHAPLPKERLFDAFELVHDFLVGLDESFLYQRIREEKGLNYKIEGTIDISRHHSMLPLYTGVEPSKVKTVQRLIRGGFKHASQLPLKEFKELQEESLGAVKAYVESPENVAIELARRELDGRGAHSYYLQQESRKKITLEEFHAAANVQNFSTFVIYPK